MTTHPTDPASTDRVVAYRAPITDHLFCAPCGESDRSTALTSDDLPDGGVCVGCGVDVLIPQAGAPSESVDDPTLGRQFGEVLRRWGLLDEVNDPKATEEFVVNDLLARVNAEPTRTDDGPQPPEVEPGAVLARHIIEQPMSTVQAALRILDWPLVFDIRSAAETEGRAVTRQAQAAHLVEHCPDHGASSAPWLACRCAEAEALRLRAEAGEASDG